MLVFCVTRFHAALRTYFDENVICFTDAAKKADTPLGPQVPQNPLIQKPGPIATSQQANADQQPLNANQNTAKVQEPVKTEAQSQPAQLAAQANKVDKPQTSGQPSPLTAQTGQAEKLQAQNQLLPQVKASSNEAAVPAVTGGQQLGKVGDQSAVPKKQGSKTQVQAQNPAPQAQNLLKQSQTSNSAADSPQSGNALAKASKSPLGEQGNNIAQSPQTVNSAAGSPDLGKAPAKLQPSAPQVGAQGNIPAQPQAGNSKETASQPQPKKLTPEERKKVIANFVPLFKPSNHKDHALSFQKGAIKHPKHTMYPECHKCPENSSYAACVKSQTLKKCNEGLNNICYTKSVKDNDAIKYEMGCADHNMCLGARAFPCRGNHLSSSDFHLQFVFVLDHQNLFSKNSWFLFNTLKISRRALCILYDIIRVLKLV